LLRAANVLALLGLGCVGAAITAAVTLVISMVDEGLAVSVVGALTLATFAGLWLVLPLARRRSADTEEAAKS
jgi:hypothetical protein